jgi:ribonuclease P protein component
MLPKKNRLLKREDFEKVKKEGKKFQGKFFGVLVLKTGGDFSRFGFIFSTKLTKKTVLRNRLKRIFREVIRGLLDKLSVGYDVIFLGRKEVLDKSFFEISEETKRVLKKAGILVEK